MITKKINLNKLKIENPRILPIYGGGVYHSLCQYHFELGYKEGVKATKKAIKAVIN